MSYDDRPAGVYDGTGPDVLVAAGTAPSVTRTIGDRGRVRALSAWCARVGMSHDTLEAIGNGDVELDPATTARLAAQLRRAGQVLRDVPVPALAWLEPGARTSVVGGVLGDDLTSDGGYFVCGSAQATVSAHLDDSGAHLLVRDAQDPTVVVRVAQWSVGPGGTVRVGQMSAPAWVASVLAPLSAGPVEVRQVPATSVVAELLVSLGELAHTAASHAGAVRISSAVDRVVLACD